MKITIIGILFIFGCTLDKSVKVDPIVKTPTSTIITTETVTGTSTSTSTVTSTDTKVETKPTTVTSTQTATSTSTTVEQNKPKYPLIGWIPEYDELIKSKLTEPMLTLPDARMASFCPSWGKFDQEARKKFYADLFYGIAKQESRYNTTTMYHETKQGIDKATGLIKLSEGLLQLSYSDALYYKGCDFNIKKDLPQLKKDIEAGLKGTPGRDTLDPFKNLSCGLIIFNRILTRRDYDYADGEFSFVLGKYWSTMRRLKCDDKGKCKPKDSYLAIKAAMKKRGTNCD